ncbi:MAG: hypothetical protein JSV91_12705 [Phycisphaerales bacterium]|nr:MAG: hypothetical protein JSV91_12705 [Phycisphaerales bacterium]
MQARLIGFGELEIDGKRYDHDVVIDGGQVRKRKKGPSREAKREAGHTPLTATEDLPWGGRQLIIGTGMYGALPVAEDVEDEADRRDVEVIAARTEDACRLICGIEEETEIHAVIHITC